MTFERNDTHTNLGETVYDWIFMVVSATVFGVGMITSILLPHRRAPSTDGNGYEMRTTSEKKDKGNGDTEVVTTVVTPAPGARRSFPGQKKVDG